MQEQYEKQVSENYAILFLHFGTFLALFNVSIETNIF